MLRRRRPTLHQEARLSLRATAEAAERGRDALAAAVPGPRRPGVPLADALMGFEAALADVREALEGWRVPEAETEWRACREALEEAAGMAERLRLEAPALDFESLVLVLKDLLAPMEEVEDMARRLGARSR